VADRFSFQPIIIAASIVPCIATLCSSRWCGHASSPTPRAL
jgi:hypothetical protein